MSDAVTPPNGPPLLPPAGPPADNNGSPPLNIAEELRDSYLTYAMSVIVSRALPDARDGLKPSQRRILVAMNGLGLGPASSTSKCAAIVGETMGKYHPHGDQSIYAALVRLAQPWNMRHRLVHSQGNFGSIAGLPPAAQRYTEARLSPVGAEMLTDLDYETVDFIETYDNKNREPLVLPCRFPNLLVNGSDGIAVGMATSIPPHNLREVCNAAIRVIDEPSVTTQRLLEEGIFRGPDFPTGGIICGQQGIMDAYTGGGDRYGFGKVILRARADIVEEGRSNHIVIREVPYQKTRIRLAEDIGRLVKEERIKGVSEIRDESSERNGEPVRIVVYLKRDADANLVLNQLYEFSDLQTSVSIILLALVDNRPHYLSLKELLDVYIRHRVEVIKRRTEFLVREAKRRSHVLEGQLIAISSLDEVIAICRRSPSRADAKLKLAQMDVASAVMERALGAEHFAALQREIGAQSSYRMTEQQAEAVVRMQLGQLAALERDEVMREFRDLRKKIGEYETLLSTDRNILAVVKADLVEIRDKYGEDRRTDIQGEVGRVTRLDLVPEEDNVVTISHNGYIKRLPLKTYRSQHRGGKGVSGGATREDDFIEHFYVASTHAYLLCFTNHGQMYWLQVLEIPEGSRTASGRSIANVLSLKPDEKITSVIPVRHFEDEGAHLFMATRQGTIKKTPLTDYSRVRKGGLIGIALDEGDTLIEVVLTRPGDEIVLATKRGMAIRFDEANTRATSRNTYGVRGIKLGKDDEVVGMVVADPQGFLLTVCENGYGKRTPFGANVAGVEEEPEEAEEPSAEVEGEAPEIALPADLKTAKLPSGMRYRKQRRGGKGVRDIRISERNGLVVGVVPVRDGDDVVLITTGGMVNRTHAEEIRVVSRNKLGVRVMGLNDDDKIASLARVAREEAEPVEETAVSDVSPSPLG